MWDDSDIRDLFDSIWRGFPIGTLLLWERPADADTVHFGPVDVNAAATERAYWVVDGQQRVTTLVGALASEPTGQDSRFELCFDLSRGRVVHAGRRPQPSGWLPLRATLESRAYLEWVRPHGAELGPDQLDLADEFCGAIRDYKVPAYIIERDDEQLLRDVFDRVNSAGKPISRAQVFHALFGGSGEGASARAVIDGLRRESFGDIDDQRVVQSLLAVRGGDVFRDLHVEFTDDEDRERSFDDTEQALRRSVRFLQRLGVPHLQLVPSTFPIPVLAAFFHLHREPEPWIERLLARWLWRGWAHGYGRSGQTEALRRAVRAVHPTKGKPTEAPTAFGAVNALLGSVPDDAVPQPDLRAFRTDSAAGRLALLALATLGPLGPDGRPIDLADELDRRRADAIADLVRGRRADLATRGFWPEGSPPLSGHEPPDVLRSQAIPDDAAAALRCGNVDGFLAGRRTSIAELLQAFLALRLEHGAIVRPPVAELFVPDADAGAVGG